MISFISPAKRSAQTFIFLIVVLLSSKSNAQWKWIHPNPQGNDLNVVSFPDNMNGWAAGNAGAIIKTTDAGDSWTQQNCGYSDDIKGIYFYDANNGYVAISNNFLYTSDGGATWTNRYRFPTQYAETMFFMNPDTGWISGSFNGMYSFYKTIDAGLTWQPQVTNMTKEIRQIQINSSGKGWLIGTSGLYMQTVNFGTAWTPASPSGINTLNGICFLNDLTGYIAGNNGLLLKSINGGANWNPVTSPSANTVNLQKILFINADSAVITADQGNSYYTFNAASSWTQVTQSNWFTGKAIAKLNSSQLVIVGSYGEILKTTNAGSSYSSKQTRVSVQNLSGVTANGTTLYACGSNGTILKSVNSGQAWQALSSGTTNSFTDIAATGTNTAVAVGDNGIAYTTSNAGTSWLPATNTNTTEDLFSVCRDNSTTLFACGGNSTILKSTNNGQNWTVQINPLDAAGYKFLEVFFVNHDTGWVSTDGFEILYTMDGGINWNLSSTNANPGINSVHFINGMHGWSATQSGDILESTDGGQSWNTIYNFSSGLNISKIVFTDASNGWVFGDGKVYRTIDGGLSWVDEYNPSGELIKDAVFTGTNNAIAVGKGLSTIIGRSGDLRLSINNPLVCTDKIYFANITAGGSFNAGNIFTVQISDEFGDFTFPFTIGSAAGTGNTSIPVTVPNGITDGTGYRMRVLASDPPFNSPVNSDPLTVHTSPDGFAFPGGLTAFCQGDSVTIYAITTPGWTYMWFKDNVAIPGANADSIVVYQTGNYTVKVDDGICDYTSSAVDVLVSVCSGISEYNANTFYKAFPNPSNGSLSVRWTDNTKVERLLVRDIQGRLLKNIASTSNIEETINLSDVPSGVYFISIEGDHPATLKIIRY